ncbi:hypothetical protein VHEMI04942 [[Torrubiella] hemipterigena]|uniref:Uncharacterized protein n=1 Tax=[Torrubiella] hemipterigena TaxID=1531966 RepID=A0A0A1T2Q2_9HYPO|nr:hypothetical protein VHEMI04942 [[Torrubiella] hemipterigena]
MVGKKSNRRLSAHISRAVEVHQRNRYNNDPAKRSTASTESKNLIPGNETNYIEPYGMAISKEKLYREGFDVRISNLTPQEMLAKWKRVAKRHITKPSKEEFYQLMSSLPLQAHLLRVGFILSPYDHNQEPRAVSCGVLRPYEFQKDGGVLTSLFAMGDLAAILTEHLFHQGYGSVRQLCLSSKDVWQSLSSFTSTWNVLTGEFDNRGMSPVFVAYTAAYTIGQLTAPLQSGRQGLFADKGSEKNWYLKVRETERDIADEVFRLRKAAFKHMAEYDDNDWTAFGRDIKPIQIDSYDESDMLTSLKTVARINQFASEQPWETYQMPLSLVAGRLKLFDTNSTPERCHYRFAFT